MLQEEWIMTMKPLADRVLIKVEKEEEKTVGGLVLATKNPAGVPAGPGRHRARRSRTAKGRWRRQPW